MLLWKCGRSLPVPSLLPAGQRAKRNREEPSHISMKTKLKLKLVAIVNCALMCSKKVRHETHCSTLKPACENSFTGWFSSKFTVKLEMWANAQGDGRPAEYMWRSLFNAAKFGWRPLLERRAVTLPRRETGWNLQGCPKLTKRSQPLECRSSPLLWGHVEEILLLNNFFSDCRCMP